MWEKVVRPDSQVERKFLLELWKPVLDVVMHCHYHRQTIYIYVYIYSHLIPFVYSMIYISSMQLVIPQSTEASPSSWLCAFTQDRPCRGGRYREVGSLLQRKTDLLALPKGAVICWSRWLLLSLGYPLANVYIAIENHIVLWENSLFLWLCSIANC